MPGLIRGVARTAVVAGTATAVSNRVSRRQANKWSQQAAQQAPQQEQYYEEPPQQQYAPPPQQYAAPAPAPAPAAGGVTDEMLSQLEKLGKLHEAGVLTDEEFSAQKAKLLNM